VYFGQLAVLSRFSCETRCHCLVGDEFRRIFILKYNTIFLN
jgi:hypothetical protein